MNAEQRERAFSHLQRGACQITSVHRTGVSMPIAEVRTDLGEQFAVFDHDVLSVLEDAHRSGRRVEVRLKRTPKGRYISSAVLYPSGIETSHPCVMCGADVRREDGVFSCAHCHFVMAST